MVDSIELGADGQANHTLAVLRESKNNAPLASDVVFLPGLKLNADPALDLTGSYNSPAGRLLEFDVKTGPNPGGWIGLHLDLSVADLTHKGVVGFAARFAAPVVTVMRVCLRSGTSTGFEDCFFDKHMLLQPEEASHVDAISVHHRDRLPLLARWRELVMFLPPHSCQLSLIDLRVFIV